jgi:hypothetical protein
MTHRPALLLPLAAALLLTACAGSTKLYEGEALDPRQASWVNVNWNGNPFLLGYYVNGKGVGGYETTLVELKPGHHRIDYAVHGFAREDVEAGRRAVESLRASERSTNVRMRWVDHQYHMEFDSQPGWGYTIKMVRNPFDVQARPVHCVVGEPAQFVPDKREPLLQRTANAQTIVCAPPVHASEGVSNETLYNPNYQPPKKDADPKGKKK